MEIMTLKSFSCCYHSKQKQACLDLLTQTAYIMKDPI